MSAEKKQNRSCENFGVYQSRTPGCNSLGMGGAKVQPQQDGLDRAIAVLAWLCLGMSIFCFAALFVVTNF